MEKTLLITLEGATLDIINGLIEEGELPVIRELLNEGASSRLRSTIPPTKGSGALSLATGLSPGTTGINDALRKNDRGSSDISVVNSTDFQNRALWDYFQNQGKKCGIVNYPFLYPPYEVDGFMISGLGSKFKQEITFPRELKEKISGWTAGYQVSLNIFDQDYETDKHLFDALHSMLDNRMILLRNLIRKNWDLLVCSLLVVEIFERAFWKYVDEQHPLFDEDNRDKYQREFKKLWRRIDGIVGLLLDEIGEDTNLILSSCHGFGSQERTFNLTKWLVEKNYMKLKNEGQSASNLPFSLKRKLLKLRYGLPQKFIPDFIFNKFYDKFLSTPLDWIDFEESKAFILPGTNSAGAIYLNDKSVEQELSADLRNIANDVDDDIDLKIFRPKELYSGGKTELLPDFVLKIGDWDTFILKNDLQYPLYDNEPYLDLVSGINKPDGIFIAKGPGFNKGVETESNDIVDVVPTILHLHDMPVPNYLDGKVVDSFLKRDKEVNYIQADLPQQISQKKIDFKDCEMTKDRLREYGTLE